ncbi:carboxylesterase/lipase family protein [Veillonella magna]|nr:carboxylesterase family protein [Veillonella magna]
MKRQQWISMFALMVFLAGTTPIVVDAKESQVDAMLENTAIHVQKNLAQTGQVFKAGPGIAITETKAGRVQGFIKNGIYSYFGIPYADATRRFEAAKPVKPWKGIRMANKVGPISPQEQGDFPNGEWGQPVRAFEMDNNCLNLNIWTPNANDRKERPVMVWLHGGGFKAGSSLESPAYDGENLSRRGDVVVVSVNHRLNVLGHLNLEKYGPQYKNSANIGIVDLVDALTWIKENIASFGGDPENITLFGESGGGAKVLTLMAIPQAKGLFQKGIVESGAVETMGPYVMTKEESERVTELTLEELGITKDTLDSLQTIPYERLVAASNKALKTAGVEYKVREALGTGYRLNWEPVVDGDFLPTHPVTKDGFAEAGRSVPLLIGSNLTEWTGFQDIVHMEQQQYDNKNTWSEETVNKKLKEAYGEKADAVVRSFVFHNVDKMLSRIGGSEEANTLENHMSDAWIHFARYGTPQTDALPRWDAYTKENGATMIFDNQIRLMHHHDEELLKLLNPDYIY